MKEGEEGWRFWVDHDGRIRDFVVGHQDEETARRAVQTYDPTITDLNFVSKARVHWSLIRMFGLAGGGAREWFGLFLPASAYPVGGVEAWPPWGGEARGRRGDLLADLMFVPVGNGMERATINGVQIVRQNGRYWIMTPSGPQWSNIGERDVNPALDYLFGERKR